MTKQKTKEKLTIKEIRIELHKIERKIRGLKGKTKLTEMYLHKVGYMIMWFRLIPIKKKVLKNWHMPDMRTISEMDREIKDNQSKEQEGKWKLKFA